MWNQDFNQKPFTIKFQFKVDDGEPSEWFEVSKSPEDICTEDKYHFIDF